MNQYNIAFSVVAVVTALYVGIAIENSRAPSYSAKERAACANVEQISLNAGWGAAEPDSVCGRVLGR